MQVLWCGNTFVRLLHIELLLFFNEKLEFLAMLQCRKWNIIKL